MKLTVIGAGTIGAGTAFNVATRDIFDEIVLVDLDQDKAEGEAMDIGQAISFHSGTEVRGGTYADAAGSHVVAMTAGKPRKEGMTRTDLLEANMDIVRSVFENEFADDAVFVSTTNPMDVINYASYRISDFPRERFVGFGGWLDSARMQYVLAEYLDEPADRIRGYVMGEHGDSQVPVFSQVTLDGRRIAVPPEDRPELRERMTESAMEVISRKGGTEWAPTFGMSEVIASIANDERRVLPCSTPLDGEYGHSDLSIGVPAVLGSSGVQEIVEWDLSDEEREAVDASAEKLKGFCAEVDERV